MAADDIARASNSHFLPRLLLKGFIAPDPTRRRQVYLFKPGSVPALRHIDKVAREPGFYAADVESSLSRRESKYAKVLELIRRGTMRPEFDPLVSEFVRQLLARTRNLRVGFAQGGKSLTTALFDHLSQPLERDIVRREALRTALASPEIARLLRSAPPSLHPLMYQIAEQAMKKIDLDGFLSAAARAVQKQDFGDAARSGQIDGLRRGLASIESDRAPAEEAKWSCQITESLLILGDCGPLALMSGSTALGWPFSGGGELTHLLVPISDRCLLVGRYGGQEIVFDPESVNLASAGMSREFFVASGNTESERRYLARVGVNAPIFSEEEIKTISRETIWEMDAKGRDEGLPLS